MLCHFSNYLCSTVILSSCLSDRYDHLAIGMSSEGTISPIEFIGFKKDLLEKAMVRPAVSGKMSSFHKHIT